MQNTTLEIHDVSDQLNLKINLDFQQFPETLVYSATPPQHKTLTLIINNVHSVNIPNLLVKNYDTQSRIIIQTSADTEQVSVGKIKFDQIENHVTTHRYSLFQSLFD